MTAVLATKERPIIFSAPMVCAILDGRKTQTRRVIRSKEVTAAGIRGIMRGTGPAWRCPYGQPGDRLWVRETLVEAEVATEGTERTREAWHYAADMAPIELDQDDPRVPAMVSWAHHQVGATHRHRDKICPSIYMPRWASRLTVEITDVRVQRLQEISTADAWAEGVRPAGVANHPGDGTTDDVDPEGATIDAYRLLWDSLNAKRGHGWASNPFWVWALTFRRVE